jgi:hypothetical protein
VKMRRKAVARRSEDGVEDRLGEMRRIAVARRLKDGAEDRLGEMRRIAVARHPEDGDEDRLGEIASIIRNFCGFDSTYNMGLWAVFRLIYHC